MQNLIKQEIFEIEVLDYLNSKKLLDKLVFTGGTMLRLCYGLDRYSYDIDFWMTDKIDFTKFFKSMKTSLSEKYKIKDSANKHYTILFEVKSASYPNRLKIEIRKEIKKVRYEKSIAYSKNTNKQVIVNATSLDDMMKAKVNALTDRKEIRDAFDIEFLIKKGIKLQLDRKMSEDILNTIDSFTKQDYKVKLASILEPGIRKYYVEENFKILRSALILVRV